MPDSGGSSPICHNKCQKQERRVGILLFLNLYEHLYPGVYPGLEVERTLLCLTRTACSLPQIQDIEVIHDRRTIHAQGCITAPYGTEY